MNKKTLAIFDFDGTITSSDSFIHFLVYCIGYPKLFIKLFPLLPTLIRFKLGYSSNHATKEKVIVACLKGQNQLDLIQIAESFSQKILPSLVRPEALEKITWHLQNGHELVLVSASPELYLTPWANQHGFSRVLATQLEFEKGKLTGRIDGKNCWGPEKVRKLEAWYGDISQFETYVYGDSRGDKEMLDLADFPSFKPFR